LTLQENELYQALYCGLCHALKKQCGANSSLFLNYDLVFLALIRLTVGEDHIKLCPHRCPVHPVHKRCVVVDNPATDYAARVLVLLTYYKLADDAADEKGFRRLRAKWGMRMLKRPLKRAGLDPLADLVKEKLASLSTLEKEGCPSIDAPAAIFGELLGEVFAYGVQTEYAPALRALGETLGRFIYAADAAEDYPTDKEKGRYNPFVKTYPVWDAQAKGAVRDGLICILADGEGAWRSLPFGESVQIRHLIENIMYDGLVHRLDFLLPNYIPPKKTRKALPYEGVLP
jgi:hypothetical protein